MSQLPLFPPPGPAPGRETMKPFASWREATEYAQSLSLDIWNARVWFDSRNTYYVKAVEK
jgi:hypothetical protein